MAAGGPKSGGHPSVSEPRVSSGRRPRIVHPGRARFRCTASRPRRSGVTSQLRRPHRHLTVGDCFMSDREPSVQGTASRVAAAPDRRCRKRPLDVFSSAAQGFGIAALRWRSGNCVMPAAFISLAPASSTRPTVCEVHRDAEPVVDHGPSAWTSVSRVVPQRSCCLPCRAFGSRSTPTGALPRSQDCSVQRRFCP